MNPVTEETFSSKQFQQDILGFALSKFEEYGNDYEAVKGALQTINEVTLNPEQVEIILQHLRRFNALRSVNEVLEGQVWKYKTRNGEEDSRFTVFKIEGETEEEIIIHISINKLQIKNPKGDPAIVNFIGHVPITKGAFINSAAELERQLEFPPLVPEAYFTWQDAYAEKKAGVFSIPVSEIVGFIEKTVSGDQ